MMTTELDGIVADIQARLVALGEGVSEARLNEMIKVNLQGLLGQPEFARKMRFGVGADEKLIGSKYARWNLSLADIEFLYDLQVGIAGLKRVNNPGVYGGPSETLQNAFKAISDGYYVPMEEVRAMDQRALDDLFPRIPLAWFHGNDRKLAKRGAWEQTQAYRGAVRAMDTAEAGYGTELIGVQYVGDLWEAARPESKVFSLLDTFEMLGPSAYLPVEAGLPEMLYVAESTASNSSNYTTSKTGSNRVLVSAAKFVIHQMWSGELEEDSILPFIPFLRRQAALSVAHYSDSLVLNGDTTNAGTGNINLDDADPADTKHYLAFDGIRHVGIVDNTANKSDMAGAITLAALADAKGRMLDTTYLFDWGHPVRPDDLVYVADPQTADDISGLDDVVTWFQQQGQPILTGQVARALGHAVIGSMAVSKTEADGKVSTTAGNNTKGQVVTFNRNGFKAGWRRRVKTEGERIPATDQTRLVHSLRLGMGRYSPTGSASGIEAADVIYDITL
jgi:hypothetical protein